VIAGGIIATFARPLAPDLGSVPDPTRWFSAALLERIAAYRTPLRVAGVAVQIMDLLVPIAIAVTPIGRRLVSRIVAVVGPDRPVRAAAGVVAAIVLLAALVRVPIGVWAYHHARAFGLSTQSLAGWFGDWGIARGVELLVAMGLAAAAYAVVRRWPRRWHLIAAPAGVMVVAAAVLVAPLLVEPLEFDFRPLPDGPMRRELERVLAADGRAQSPLLVADASRRTTMQNAYVSGLWGTRRIVLYDTLLERDPAEVAQVLAHELAHERNQDLIRSVLAGSVGWILACMILAAVLRLRVLTGRQVEPHDPRGAAALLAVIAVLLVLATPITSWYSRRAEAAADLGALALTSDPGTFCAMQRGLVERNLSDPAPPTWQRLWWSTHPPPASRLELARRSASSAAPECDHPKPALFRNGRESGEVTCEAVDDRVPRPRLLDPGARLGAHLATAVLVGQEPDQRGRHGMVIVAVGQHARATVGQRLGAASAPPGDDRDAARLRFQEHHAEALLLQPTPPAAVRVGEHGAGAVIRG
jgi:STE24 endopeptidase